MEGQFGDSVKGRDVRAFVSALGLADDFEAVFARFSDPETATARRILLEVGYEQRFLVEVLIRRAIAEIPDPRCKLVAVSLKARWDAAIGDHHHVVVRIRQREAEAVKGGHLNVHGYNTLSDVGRSEIGRAFTSLVMRRIVRGLLVLVRYWRIRQQFAPVARDAALAARLSA